MVENHHQSKTKTMRFNEIYDIKEEEDYISLLPDCLLIDIISRLPETKEAIRTGTLSKRWQHLWPYVSNLTFYMSSFDDWNHQTLSDFVSFVDKTLTQCRQFSLTKFKLHTPYDVMFESHVNNLIRYAFSCNVQDLDLSILNKYRESEFVLDDFFFNNSSFTRLRLNGCVFNPAGVITWKNLTSLVIYQGNLDDGLIKNITSGCPVLETLYLLNCYGFGRIDITSKSVKKLLIDGYNDPEDQWDLSDIVEINAPHILSLQLIGGFLLWKVVLLNVSSLVVAELNYWKGGHWETTKKEGKEELLKGLILSLQHVKKLQIGYQCLSTLARLEAKGFTVPSNLERPDWPDYDSSE